MRTIVFMLSCTAILSACASNSSGTPVKGGAATFDYHAGGKFTAKFGSAYTDDEIRNHSRYCKTGKPTNLVIVPLKDGGAKVSGMCA